MKNLGALIGLENWAKNHDWHINSKLDKESGTLELLVLDYAQCNYFGEWEKIEIKWKINLGNYNSMRNKLRNWAGY